MKIAVYTIALNEEQFVEPWFQSAKEADYLLIADTGSTDQTITKAKALGINVIEISINPWRFDHARNASLDGLPDDIDYAIALDMDEVLLPGWRQSLELVTKEITRPRYEYTWSWNEDGSPGLVYGGDKIHARHNYRWKHPVHEVISCDSEEVQGWIDLKIHHHPDTSKSRSQYFPLLEMSVAESPEDDRNAFYFARELYFNNMYDRASLEFNRHLNLASAKWTPERAASMRYLAKINHEDRETWLLRACAEAPEMREPWTELAQHYYEVSNWVGSYFAAVRATEIKNKPLAYLCEAFAWGATPDDLASIAAWNLGLIGEAIFYGNRASELAPNDSRIASNLYQFRVKEEAS